MAAKGTEGDLQKEITQDASAISKWERKSKEPGKEVGSREEGKAARQLGRVSTFFAPCSSSTPSPITM